MIKQYFKQALAQLRQQPLLTTISVLGHCFDHLPDYGSGHATANKNHPFCSGE